MVDSKINQGDIIKIENLSGYFLVVSKDFFNVAEQAMLCPIVDKHIPDPLHIQIKFDNKKGTVLCEHVRYFDLRIRGYMKAGSVTINDVMNITDAIQGIFDFY